METRLLKIRDVYDDYINKGGKNVSYQLFSKLAREYNKGLTDLLLKGHKIDLGYRLGTLAGVRVKRAKGAMRVDHGRTNKNRDENGKARKVYYHQESYYGRIKWYINQVRVKNRSFYEFKAARGDNKDAEGNPVKSLANKFFEYIYDPVKKFRFPLEDNSYEKSKKRKNASTRSTVSR